MGQGSSAPAEITPTGGTGPEVILNIYEPADGQGSMMGMGIYHTGIEISGVEYAYGGGSVAASGVYTQTPRVAPPGSQWKFKMSQPLGKAKVDAKKIASTLDKVREEFKADEYHVVGRNCNHFTEAAATALGVAVNYPSYVNRAARMGQRFGQGPPPKPKEEPPKSVFATTQGHTLDGSAPAAAASSGAKPAVARQASTGKAAGAGGEEFENPWRKKGFQPPGMATLQQQQQPGTDAKDPGEGKNVGKEKAK